MSQEELRQFGVDVFDSWTAMWNQELKPGAIMAETFHLRYAQEAAEAINDVHTPAQLEAVIAAWHGARPGLRFAPEGTAAVDLHAGVSGPSGIITRPYLASVEVDGSRVAKSGIDMLRIRDGKIVEVWSVSAGGRPFHS